MLSYLERGGGRERGKERQRQIETEREWRNVQVRELADRQPLALNLRRASFRGHDAFRNITKEIES